MKPRQKLLAGVLLAALMLLLGLRLAGSETLRETLQQKAASYAAMHAPRPASGEDPNSAPIPLVGPAFTATYSGAAMLLAGLAVMVAGSMTRRRLGQFLLMVVLAVLLGLSAAHAGNRFNAVVGAVDVLGSLSAAWGLAVLCEDSLLGKRGRQAAIAAVVAILALGAGKALMQYFVEIPDTLQYMREHREEAMRGAGIDPQDAVQSQIFMSRLNSREVTGFGVSSNVFATEMIALGGLAAALVIAGAWGLRMQPVEGVLEKKGNWKGRKLPASGSAQVPAHLLALIAVGVVGLAAVVVMPMTDSNGGMAAGLLCLAALVAGGIWARQVVAWRRVVLGVAVAGALLGGLAVVGYGLTQHRLPTKSLMFRWQYWTGGAPMVREFPAWGVGLNNFGDYYLRFKAPSSPEDVKDPHNFFVRLVTEAGVPATVLVAAWLGWFLWGALGKPRGSGGEAQVEGGAFSWSAVAAAGGAALAWGLLRMLGIAYSDFELILSFLFAGLGVAVFVAAFYLLWHLEEVGAAVGVGRAVPATRFVAVGGVIATLAMLLYDQVNMALVTGPCAMLFWMLLAVGDASRDGASRRAGRMGAVGVGAAACAGGVGVLVFFALPVAAGTFALDPAPFERTYIAEYNALSEDLARHDVAGAAAHTALAEKALGRAIELSPESGELHSQRIVFHRFLNQQNLGPRPLAADMRKVLTIDRANARVRVELALPDSDLPKDERIAALEEALRFDAALPADEAKRLSEAQKAEVRDKIAALKGAAPGQ